MKVVFLSTFDASGGAAIACLRLVEAMRQQNIDAKVLVLEKKRTDDWIQEADGGSVHWKSIKKHLLYYIQQHFITSPGFQFTGINFQVHDLTNHPWVQSADAICLHWVNHGFLNDAILGRLFALGKPIIWHMHDFWAFTGGCHYPGSCQEFRNGCNSCVALKKPFKFLSPNQFSKRVKAFKMNSPVLVGASNWIANEARSSSLGRYAMVEHIPNPLDPYFEPGNKAEAREQLHLNPEKKYILFAAMNIGDRRKGFHLLKGALEQIQGQDIGCIIAGKFKPEDLREVALEIKTLGPSNKAAMRQAYRAADAFVIPSIEENLPNTVLESLGCGTPVAGFSIGGIPEMVENGLNGFLAPTLAADALAKAIQDTVKLSEHKDTLNNCADSLQAYLPPKVADQYIQLIKSRINKA